ncbi:terminase [Microbacterium phage Curie]
MTPKIASPKLKVKEYSWYNFDRICSYNAILNFIVGSRGEGKTFGAIKRLINRYIKYGEQFIYMRRTDKELRTAIPSFFVAIEMKNIFPEWDFRVNGGSGEIAPRSSRDDAKRVWHTLVFFVPLSRAQAFKSANFSLVTGIIYDEFIKEKGYTHYLPNEFDAFMGFYSTVDRNQDKTVVYFLANAVTIMNPYFISLNVQPDLQREFSKLGIDPVTRVPYVVVHVSDNKDFKEQIGQTRYARFLNGSAFGEYAIGNTFADSHQALIKRKPSSAKYRYTLETKTGTFDVWQDFEEGLFYLETKRHKSPLILTLLAEQMSDSKRLVTPTSKLIASLRTAFTHGRAYFDKASTRNTFAQVFNK